MELKGYISILKDRFHWAVAGFILVFGTFLVSQFMRGVEYTATASFIGNFPSLKKYSSKMEDRPRLTLDTMIEILQNKEWLDSVAVVFYASRAKDQKPKVFLEEQMSLSEVKGIFNKSHPRSKVGTARFRKKRTELSSKINVNRNSKFSQIFQVKARAGSKNEARRLVNSYVVAMKLRGNDLVSSMFSDLRSWLKDRKVDLRHQIGFRDGMSVGQFDDQSPREGSLLELYQSKLRELGTGYNRLEDVKEKMSTLRNELESIRPKIVQLKVQQVTNKHFREMALNALSAQTSIGGGGLGSGVVSSNLTQEIESKIRSLKMKLAGELRNRTKKHPKVKSIKAQIDFLKSQIPRLRQEGLKDTITKFSTRGTKSDHKLQTYKKRVAELENEISKLSEPLSKLEQLKTKIDNRKSNLREINDDLRKIKKAERSQNLIKPHSWAENTNKVVKKSVISPWLAILFGIMSGIGLAYLRDYLDSTVRTDYDVRRYLNLPLFALVREEEDQSRVHIKEHPVKSPMSEVFNTAATLLQSSMQEGGLKSISLTSAMAKEGKTTMSINLATAFARKGLRTALVDLDLRGPRIHKHMNVSNDHGVSQFIQRAIDQSQSREEFQDQIQTQASSIIRPSDVENLSVITTGDRASQPVQLLESPYTPVFLEHLEEQFDIVLMDTPPVKTVGDSLTISRYSDGTLLVVGSGMVGKQDVSWTKHLLTNVRAHILGVILNRYEKQKGVEYYYYYTYYNKDYHYGV